MVAPQTTVVAAAPVTTVVVMANPVAESIKSMNRIAGILALIFGILIGMIWALWSIFALIVLSAFGVGIYAMPGIIFGLLAFILGLLFYMKAREINTMIDQGRYIEAKSKALIWSILGIIFVFFLPGLIMLIGYLKFDQLIMPQQVVVVQQAAPQPQTVVVAQPAPQPAQTVVVSQPAPQPVVVSQPAPQPVVVQQAPAAQPAPAPAAVPGQKFCTACGTPNPPSAGFCSKCGNKMA